MLELLQICIFQVFGTLEQNSYVFRDQRCICEPWAFARRRVVWKLDDRLSSILDGQITMKSKLTYNLYQECQGLIILIKISDQERTATFRAAFQRACHDKPYMLVFDASRWHVNVCGHSIRQFWASDIRGLISDTEGAGMGLQYTLKIPQKSVPYL